ncbi:type II secretion system protein [Neorhodopirellula pilleata]|uniref:Type II secretion system protein G n=1 Tax=Neorhodopirellula pilleata TaxID=2714738 RepID=A0A5C6A339_9BACT|nr:prepilin-type N-terminal cleavage/methylation domain-containing protein [Neorhodopirellula pilleata]TWT93668.1 Type II secretion system protein G precursor [Neorhodopirellula pilleata]
MHHSNFRQPLLATRRSARVLRTGFTLVEILVVIAIIGILMAILVPAVTNSIKTAKETAIRLEIDLISQALEAYKLKYGDYPPDFSDWKSVERHFRKAFPEIDDSELKLLAQYTHLDENFDRVPLTADLDPRSTTGSFTHYRQAIDAAEALVFCLGGFSQDKKHPFTGSGGPLSLITSPSASVVAGYGLHQYNVDRDNAFMDFSEGLNLFVANDPTSSTPNPCGASSAYTFSGDEYVATVVGTSVSDAFSARATSGPFASLVFLVDPFPVYSLGDELNPVVYFNSRTYTNTFTPTFEKTPGASSTDWLVNGGGTDNRWHALNIYMHPASSAEFGVARPYLSSQADTNGVGFLWAERSRFQLISAGLDQSYGGVVLAGVVDPVTASTAGAAGTVNVFATGQSANALGTLSGSGAVDKYEETTGVYGSVKPQLDNITNFSTRTLESDLP